MAELRSSYRRMALRTHPDKGGSPEDFRQVLEAFAVLSSARARAAYDSSLRGRKEAAGSRSRTTKHTTLNPKKKPQEGRAQPACSTPQKQAEAQQRPKSFSVPPPEGHTTCGSDAKKQTSTQPTSNHPANQVSACMARLRVLAVQMPRPQREASLQALLPQLRSRLLEFMAGHKKSEVDSGQVQHAAERRHSRRGMLGIEGAETPQERVLEDPMAIAPVSPRSYSSKSSSTSDESDIDEVLALENEECSTLFAIEDEADVAMVSGEDDSGDIDPDCTLPAAATRTSNRQQAGRSGFRGVSRKVNTVTGKITYQAGVIFNNLKVRSCHTANVEESVDFHIILVQLRECIEQGVEGGDGVEGPLVFEQSLRAACKQRQEELSKMSLSFSVAFTAFGVRFYTPITTSLEEALEVRSRMFTAREQGVTAVQACLLEVLMAGRTDVHRLASGTGSKRSRNWSQAEAEDFVGHFGAKCKANQLRREALQRRKEALEERLQQRRAHKAIQKARKLERRHQQLQQRWQRVVGRAQLALQQEQKLDASSQQKAAAAVAGAARAKVRADSQARRLAESNRRLLWSRASMQNLTFDQQQAAAETAAAAAAASKNAFA
ncbi:unnamed protein product [Polarella glacialis]|uniref:J domain-containing protein n=1 Tax=Polarella glacialis TaxID=89957 RepID=A0A813DZD6_POLGL|nr:unnamed protein product [Polarella glacialis]